MSSDWWYSPRTISVIVDNDSWILPYASQLVQDLNQGHDTARLIRNYDDVQKGDVAFYLGCLRITPADILQKHRKNLVVHESALPHGRGFAPMTWQILEGKHQIPISLIEMSDGADEGPVALQDVMSFEGHELCAELRHAQGVASCHLCKRYLSAPSLPQSTPQSGEASYYPRRRPKDSELDPEQTLAAQFNLLRTVNNTDYPAFFDFHGHRYKLTIEKITSEEK